METQGKSTSTGSNQSTQGGSSSGVNEAVTTAREQGRQALEQGKQKIGETVEQAKHQATEMAGQAKEQAASAFDERKSQAAHRLEGVAYALRQTSQELHNQEDEAIARYTEAAADQVERFSSYLQQKDLNQLLAEVKHMAQRQPELFVAGALAAGFLVGRFFKSSGSPSSRGYSAGYGYGPEGQVYSGSYGSGYTPDYDRGYDRSYDRGYGYYDAGQYEDRGSWEQGYGGQGYNRGVQGQGYQGYGDRGYGEQGYERAYGSSGEYSQGQQSTFEQTSSQSSQSGLTESGGGNYSATGTQPAGSSAQSGTRTPANPTGGSNDLSQENLDQGRSNPTREEGRQRDTGTTVHPEDKRGQQKKE